MTTCRKSAGSPSRARGWRPGRTPASALWRSTRVRATRASHSVEAYSYLVEEKPRPGVFHPEKAKELLGKKGVTFKEIDVSGNRELRTQMTQRANGGTTVPQIFIGATHVGGCDDLYALEDAGKLDPLLNSDKPA